ncbi:MAG: hypothetical protein LUF32_02350 [Clostridiales bacterium]|nr:hypothetical protein [Clostridiales bacterium]
MKKRKQLFKTGVAMASAAALTVGMLPVSAMASVSYDPPSSGMEEDENVLTGATAAANTVVLSVLGINVTSTNSAGMYSSSGSAQNEDGTDSSNLGIFGSDINDAPDPYIYNFFYNLYNYGVDVDTEHYEDYSETANADWTATPYTLLWSSNKSGASGQASGTTTITINGVTKTTNPAFYYEPDILLGGTSNGYATELANYQTDYNADYDPTIFLGYTGTYSTSGTRSDGLGMEYNQFDMTRGVVYLGSVVQNLMNETGKVNRYDQGAYEISVDYDKYNRGLYYYVLSEIAEGKLTQVRYVSALTYDTDTGFTVSQADRVTQGTDRTAQYASGIGVDIFDLLEDGYVFSDGSTAETTTITSTSGRETTTKTGYIVTVDQLIEILNEPTQENELATGVVLTSIVDTEDDDLAEAGIRFLADLPECVYGMTMQTVENGMGIPYYIGYFYYDQDNDLNPISYIYYWMENFYHVSDNDAMDTVINNMLEDASLPDELQLAGSHAANYSSSLIESQITAGIEYYTETLEPSYDAMVEAGEIDSDSALYWSCLDTSVGIGSDVRDTNVNYDCTSGESFTDDYGNEVYSFTFTEKSDTADTLAVRRIANNGTCTFYISYSNDSETADVKFIYGKSTDEVLVGDWDGDGVDTIAVRRGNTYYFLNVASEDIVSGESYVADAELTYGKSTDEVLVGDWDSDGKDTLCVRRGSEYYFSNDLTSNRGTQVSIGSGSETALAGDWDGDGADTVCLNSGNLFTVYDASGTAGDSYTYGSAKKTYDGVLAGDWDADGVDTICLRLGNVYYFTNSASGASTASELAYGKSTDEVFAGAWK